MNALIAIDTETGGLVAGTHALLSVGMVTEFGEEFHQLILPGNLVVEEQAAKKNGYTYEKWVCAGAVNAVTAGIRMAEWLDWVRSKHGLEPDGLKGVAHPASFDRPFVDWLERVSGAYFGLDRRWECSQGLLGSMMRAEMFPETKSASLDAMRGLRGLPARKGPHDALDDARDCLVGYQSLVALLYGMARAVVNDAKALMVSGEETLGRMRKESVKMLPAGLVGILESGFDEPQVALINGPGAEPKKERLVLPGNPEEWEHDYKLMRKLGDVAEGL